MNSRILLLSSAALLIPISPALAQASTAPTGTQPPAFEPPPHGATGQASGRGQAALAPAAETPDELGDEEAPIVVTGSRPRGSVVGDIPPVNTLDARDVRATGATNISELLDAIAPQIGSARGRGGEQPVLLLNGQRISSFRELRDIPTEAIQRVDIMPEEVALKYGYRADQKVVNIVLRQRFRSTTAQAGGGGATEGGYGSGNADLTRFLVQRNGRTTFNLHVAGNSMLTEAERDVRFSNAPPDRTSERELAARSLVGTKDDVRASATFNRQLSTVVSGTVNTELEHTDGRSLIGLNQTLLMPLARTNSADTAHVGGTLNGQTKSQWRWTVTGNTDLAHTSTRTDRDRFPFPYDRASETTASADVTATANGSLFKVPAGNASTTIAVGGNTVHLDSSHTTTGIEASHSLSRTLGLARASVDLPISRRGHDFSALGNLTLNANAEINQLSDFGTLSVLGAGVNWSPADRLNFIASWTREEGAPTINQLGDPLLTTPDTRIFDFTTGQTVLITAVTGGNPNLQSDRRNVMKLSGNWQPFKNADLRLRAEYVHQRIEGPIEAITVTPQIEAAFPDRFLRRTVCDQDGTNCRSQLTAVDLRPVNFASSDRDQLRFGFDFSHPLKSRQPSQAVLQQMRAQFGFPPAGRAARGGGAGGGAPSDGGASTPQGGPFGGGRGFGEGRGRGGGFFGGGSNRGRVTFSLTDTLTFVDRVQIAPGIPGLDYLHGAAAGQTGGTPRHNIEAEAGWFNNGLGARIGATWRSATNVNTANRQELHFSPYGKFDLRLFANPGDIPELVVKHPWLRGTQVRFEVNNLFNARPNVRDPAGSVPLNYQADLLEPLGRTVMISFRKLFLPSPAWFRRQFQLERQQQQGTRG